MDWQVILLFLSVASMAIIAGAIVRIVKSKEVGGFLMVLGIIFAIGTVLCSLF
jgi:hypothetical protein